MVQGWPEDVSRQGQYPFERRFASSYDDGRPVDQQDVHRRGPPMVSDSALHELLRAQCGITGTMYFVASWSPEVGCSQTYLSPGQLRHDDYESSFFDREKFAEAMKSLWQNNQTHLANSSSPEAIQYAGSLQAVHDGRIRPAERRPLPPSGDDDRDDNAASRKRQRARISGRKQEKEKTVTLRTRKGVEIHDSETVKDFYSERLDDLQQGACKLLSKAWVKVAEPKKQTAHPYTKGDEGAPEWWPKPWGPTKEEKVRHKEPDHLYKTERMGLLLHLMGLATAAVTYPRPENQKFGLNLTVKKLEDATWEALSGWLAASETNASRKETIHDIFRVAKIEERYKDGSIDGTTKVFVYMKENKKKGQTSKYEHVKDSYEEGDPLSPPRPAKPSAAPRAGPNSSTGSVVADLPMRTATFAAQQGPMMDYMNTPQQHAFGESTMSAHPQPAVNSSAHVDMGHHHHTGSDSRRGSLFADFTAPGSSSVFSNQWQPVSSAAHPPPGYAYASPHTHPDPQGYGNPTLPMAPTERQGYMPSAFNDLTRGGYDANAMFRQHMPPSPESQAPPYGYASSLGADMRGPHPPMNPGSRHDVSADGSA